MWKTAISIGAVSLLLCLSAGTGFAATISGHRTTSGHKARIVVPATEYHKGSGHRARLHAVPSTLHVDMRVGRGYHSRLRIESEIRHRRHVAYRERLGHFEKRPHMSRLHGHTAIVVKQKLGRPHRHHVKPEPKNPPPRRHHPRHHSH